MSKRASLGGEPENVYGGDVLERLTGGDQVKPQNSKTAKPQDAKEFEQYNGKPELIKATFYLYPEQILAIDEMQSAEFRKTRKKPDRSELVRRAIMLLHDQEING